jgi:uncharacterized membrane protein YccF (DUF307 family)
VVNPTCSTAHWRPYARLGVAIAAVLGSQVAIVTTSNALAAWIGAANQPSIWRWTWRHTNWPYLIIWLCVLASVLWRRYPHWTAWFRADRPRQLPLRTRLFVLGGAALVLAYLYTPSVVRITVTTLNFPHPARALETIAFTPLLEEVLFRGLLEEETERAAAARVQYLHYFTWLLVTALTFAAWHVPFGDHAWVAHALFGLAMALVRIAGHGLAAC